MAVEKELKNGTVMWPVRIAAAGKTVTPGGAVEILDILGREESLKRLEIGLESSAHDSTDGGTRQMADEIKNVEGEAAVQGNFIWDFIKEDTAEGGKFEGKKVHTRFPPEPNGYLHIVMQRLFALTLVLPSISAESAIFVWMIPTLQRKM